MSVRNKKYHKRNSMGQEYSLHFCKSDIKIILKVIVTMQYRCLLKRQIDNGQKCAQKSIADKSVHKNCFKIYIVDKICPQKYSGPSMHKNLYWTKCV